jgi:hypothetical protein
VSSIALDHQPWTDPAIAPGLSSLVKSPLLKPPLLHLTPLLKLPLLHLTPLLKPPLLHVTHDLLEHSIPEGWVESNREGHMRRKHCP